jgi:GTP cyclohydrolase I
MDFDEVVAAVEMLIEEIGGKLRQFASFCEHHLLPFFGKIHVIYVLKDGTVISISKLALAVDKFSKRLQLQDD